VDVPDLMVGETSITSIALVLHELATNSTKYGALGVDTGKISIDGFDSADTVRLIWTESGGPAPKGAPSKAGFGSGLIERAMLQMGGSILQEWPATGAIITMELKKALVGA
jgi:two-component sensor histidine kinase